MYEHNHNRGHRRKTEREGDQKCSWRNDGWKLPKPEEGNRFPDIGGIESWKKKGLTPRYDIIKMAKNKEWILKAAREKQSHIEDYPRKIIRWFNWRNFGGQKRVSWYIFKVLKGKTFILGHFTLQGHHLE